MQMSQTTSRRFRSPLLFAFFLYSTAATESNSEDCVYTLYVKTDSMIKSGTDAKISVELHDESGRSVRMADLEEWGLMGPNYDYFERGDLDIFSGKGPCVGSPLCRLNLTSDGSGQHHGWFCDYVEVTSTGAHQGCSKTIFYVQQWLATDAPPYSLSTVLDGCGQQKLRETDQPLIVKNDHNHDINDDHDHDHDHDQDHDQDQDHDHDHDHHHHHHHHDHDHHHDHNYNLRMSGGSDAAL